jgi:hypothetical protein
VFFDPRLTRAFSNSSVGNIAVMWRQKCRQVPEFRPGGTR